MKTMSEARIKGDLNELGSTRVDGGAAWWEAFGMDSPDVIQWKWIKERSQLSFLAMEPYSKRMSMEPV